MTLDHSLLTEQHVAATHVGSHARLIAGPGTGKTRVLTERICHLISDLGVNPDAILALTFTRAAAAELRHRVTERLGAAASPHISTLHSYALRALLKNPQRFKGELRDLHIADNWEERHLIFEDIKARLGLHRIKEVEDLFHLLSSDWETLRADGRNGGAQPPNPKFVTTWKQHQTIFAYMLRSELVYQVKRGLEQDEAFRLIGPPQHLLVDEFQDLNPCDLAVVKEIARRGAELFVAGDDDQSIYGFRHANPEGIRRFPEDYEGAVSLELSVCKRCSSQILALAEWVADSDTERIAKHIRSEHDGDPPRLLQFKDQYQEARGIAGLCRHLIVAGLPPGEILLLLRSDHRGGYSTVLRSALSSAGVPVAPAVAAEPLDETPGRTAYAYLRLLADERDRLAWRTLLFLRPGGVGKITIDELYEIARNKGWSFSEVLEEIVDRPSEYQGRHYNSVRKEVASVRALIRGWRAILGENSSQDTLLEAVGDVVKQVSSIDAEQQSLRAHFCEIICDNGIDSVSNLVQVLMSSNSLIEQERNTNVVNILSMHQAKGLTAEAVVVVGAEQESIPGYAKGESGVGDERRLFYVSLTRARRHLFITYCNQRTGQQARMGANSGSPDRRLTEFLRDGPMRPELGVAFVSSLETS